jgi:hypothetical protein
MTDAFLAETQSRKEIERKLVDFAPLREIYSVQHYTQIPQS